MADHKEYYVEITPFKLGLLKNLLTVRKKPIEVKLILSIVGIKPTKNEEKDLPKIVDPSRDDIAETLAKFLNPTLVKRILT